MWTLIINMSNVLFSWSRSMTNKVKSFPFFILRYHFLCLFLLTLKALHTSHFSTLAFYWKEYSSSIYCCYSIELDRVLNIWQTLNRTMSGEHCHQPIRVVSRFSVRVSDVSEFCVSKMNLRGQLRMDNGNGAMIWICFTLSVCGVFPSTP